MEKNDFFVLIYTLKETLIMKHLELYKRLQELKKDYNNNKEEIELICDRMTSIIEHGLKYIQDEIEFEEKQIIRRRKINNVLYSI